MARTVAGPFGACVLIACAALAVAHAHAQVPAPAPRLEALGHPMHINQQTSGAQAIVRAPRGWIGGADPRREGVVRGD